MTEKTGKSESSRPAAAAQASPAPATPAPREMNSGRVAFDARGNAVWEWRTGDGEFKRDASTTIVRKLEPTGLAIEATGIVRRPALKAASAAPEPTTGALAESAPPKLALKEPSGCDPYDSSRNSSHVRQAARRAPTRPVSKTVPAPERKGIIGRLLGRR